MSEHNIELHRRAVQAFNSRDIETIIAHCDPSCEFRPLFAAVVSGVTVYQGHDGMRRWHRDFEDTWGDDIRIAPEAYFDLGEHTLLFYVLHARGRQSGAEVAMPLAEVSRWRDGLTVSGKVYARREDALRDLGVSEDELEPIAP